MLFVSATGTSGELLNAFMHYDLGFSDHETGRVECAQNPFEAKVLPMSPE